MKWLFRLIIAILLVFIGCCGAGFFLPAIQIVETHISIETYPDEVFTELSDLRSYPAWFHGFEAVDETQIIFAGAERGIGQSAAWRLGTGIDDRQFGNLEILQMQTDNFVTLQYEQGAQTISMTYALQLEAENDAVLLLARYERALGGFPYLSRIGGKLSENTVTQDLSGSLDMLKSIIEMTGSE